MLRNCVLGLSLGSLLVALVLSAGCGKTEVGSEAYPGTDSMSPAERAYDMEMAPETRLGQGPGQRGDQFDLIEGRHFGSTPGARHGDAEDAGVRHRFDQWRRQSSLRLDGVGLFANRRCECSRVGENRFAVEEAFGDGGH